MSQIDLRARAARAAINLDKLSKELQDAFAQVEQNSLSGQLTAEEINAYRFFQELVKTGAGTIDEVKDIFMLCVSAHEDYRVNLERHQTEHREALKFYRAMRLLWSGKVAAAAIISTVAAVAYKFLGGE